MDRPSVGESIVTIEGAEVLEAELVEDGGIGAVLAAVGYDGRQPPFLVPFLVCIDKMECHVQRHLYARHLQYSIQYAHQINERTNKLFFMFRLIIDI